jgi:hypothetical protein
MISRNLRRPHPYQISDSTFEVRERGGRFMVMELWWVIAKSLDKDDMEAEVATFDTRDEAQAKCDQLASR